MKTLFIMLLLSFSAFAVEFESGLYECQDGNNSSICPQKIKTEIVNGKLSSLSVYYSGYCNDQGPFSYACNESGICEDTNIRFTIKSSNEYLWENFGYDFYCNFKKK